MEERLLNQLKIIGAIFVIVGGIFGAYLFIASDRASAKEFYAFVQQTEEQTKQIEKRFLKQDKRDLMKDIAYIRIKYMDKLGEWYDDVIDEIKESYIEMMEEKEDINAELKELRRTE